jgi:hypothetical protein
MLFGYFDIYKSSYCINTDMNTLYVMTLQIEQMDFNTGSFFTPVKSNPLRRQG